MRILYVANVHRHFNAFHKPYMKLLHNMGHEIDVVANGDDKILEANQQYKIDIQRSPYKLKNIKAFFQLKKIIETKEYDVIHCHTPMGGFLGRLASIKSRKRGTKVIYTSHGFHFCKGGPVINWILYYPIERIMANFTDAIITINTEDRAILEEFKVDKKYSIPGIGLDEKKFQSNIANSVLQKKRKDLELKNNDFVIISIGDLTIRKNHKIIIESISKLNDSNIKLLICGKGNQEKKLKKLIKKLNLENQVFLLGYREDIPELLKISDVFVFPSLWEGLGMAGIEAIATGVPLIASERHGIKDYAINGFTAITCDPNNSEEWTNAIFKLKSNPELRKKMIKNGQKHIEKFYITNSLKRMEDIYIDFFEMDCEGI